MTDPTTAMTVADVMQVTVKSVPSEMPLSDLEQELVSANVSGFPVVDDLKLVGVVSRSDIIRRLCDEREVARETSDFYFDEIGFHESKMKSLKDIADRVGERLESLTVCDVMANNPWTYGAARNSARRLKHSLTTESIDFRSLENRRWSEF